MSVRRGHESTWRHPHLVSVSVECRDQLATLARRNGVSITRALQLVIETATPLELQSIADRVRTARR